MTRDLSAIIKDYVETKRQVDNYSDCFTNGAECGDELFFSRKALEIYHAELEQKINAIYNSAE